MLVAFCLDQVVELAGGGFEGAVGCDLALAWMCSGFLEEKRMTLVGFMTSAALSMRWARLRVAEVSVCGCGPALAERLVFDEGRVESAEVFGEGAVMDAERVRRGDGDSRIGPLVLQGAAVGGAFGEEGGDFVGAAADAEGADGSLLTSSSRRARSASSWRSAAVASWRSQRSMWSVRRAARLRSREALAWAAVKVGRSVLRVAALAV